MMKVGRRPILALCVAAVVVPLSACSHRQAAPMPLSALDEVPPDLVGVDDTFEVRVYGEPDLTNTYRVSADGTIHFPLAGKLQVAGLRTGDIQKRLTDLLRDSYLKDPQVTVVMKEWNSRKLSVLGQVQKPGSVSYHPN